MRAELRQPPRERARRFVQRDPKLVALVGMTPEEARAWAESQARDLAGARAVLGDIAAAVAYLLGEPTGPPRNGR